MTSHGWILRDGMKLLVPTALEKGRSMDLCDVTHDPHETKDPAAERFFLPWAKALFSHLQLVNATLLVSVLAIGIGVPVWLQRRRVGRSLDAGGAERQPSATNEAEWRNPQNWTGPKWLSVYFSKRDSRAWVPKQIPSMGWTVNLGNPRGALALLAIVGVIIAALTVVPFTLLTPRHSDSIGVDYPEVAGWTNYIRLKQILAPGTQGTGKYGDDDFRVFLADRSLREPRERAYEPLKRLGCIIERAEDRWAAIDVPPSIDIHAVVMALRRGEREGRWEYEDAHFGHPRA